MLITYFKIPVLWRGTVLDSPISIWRTSLSGSRVKSYQRFTIRRPTREVAHFAGWAEAEGLALRDLDRGALHRLCSQLAERNSLRYPCGKQRQICHSACLLIDFLEEIGAVEACPPYRVDARSIASVGVQRMDADAARDVGYHAQQIPPGPFSTCYNDLGTEPSTFDAISLPRILAPTRELFQSMEIEEPGYGCADVLALFDCPGLLRAGSGTRHSDCREMAAVLAAQVSFDRRC